MFTFMAYNICDGITAARLQSLYSKNSLLTNIAHTYFSLYIGILLEGQTSIAYTCKKAVNFQTSGVKHAVIVIKSVLSVSVILSLTSSNWQKGFSQLECMTVT